ncbi:MAG: type I restriction endonuclease, partial [archaeon]
MAEYTPNGKRISDYQSEAELESAFIEQLKTQAYEYVAITSEADLVLNLRKQLEKLNNFNFTDGEWNNFLKSEIANPNQNIEDKTATIQEDHIKNLVREDGSIKNVYLLKKDNIHDNSLQIINQYA